MLQDKLKKERGGTDPEGNNSKGKGKQKGKGKGKVDTVSVSSETLGEIALIVAKMILMTITRRIPMGKNLIPMFKTSSANVDGADTI